MKYKKYICILCYGYGNVYGNVYGNGYGYHNGYGNNNYYIFLSE